MFTFVLMVLALIGIVAIVFFVYVVIRESKSRPRSREELLFEVEALRSITELHNAAWAAERRLFLEALKHLRGR